MELLITWMQHHHILRNEDSDISYEHVAQLESNKTGV